MSIDISRLWREEVFICKNASLLQRSNISIEKMSPPLALQRSPMGLDEVFFAVKTALWGTLPNRKVGFRCLFVMCQDSGKIKGFSGPSGLRSIPLNPTYGTWEK